MQDADVLDISKSMKQVAGELEQVRVEARENASMYQQAAAQAKSEAFKAHGEVGRARAEAVYQEGRASQLEGQLEEMKRHLSTVVVTSTRHQVSTDICDLCMRGCRSPTACRTGNKHVDYWEL